MRIAVFFLILLVGTINSVNAQFNLSGTIVDKTNKESLPGATVFDTLSYVGTASNAYGFFSVTFNQPQVIIRISYVGYKSQLIEIDLRERNTLDVELEEEVTSFDDIIVTAERDQLRDIIQTTSMGTVSIKPQELKNIPTFAGESDLLKVMQLMPGVTQGSEASTGVFVRGGTDDQNLIVLDDAVLYNVGHLFGFFSVFNSDAIKDVQLIKGAFPAQHGGRLSSVMDIRMKEGSLQRWNANGGIGLLTSRIEIDGPIIKDKLGLMVSGRRTYFDQLLRLQGVIFPYYFYDFNGKMNYVISDKDRIYLSTYYGDDILDFGNSEEDQFGETQDFNFGFKLGNFSTTLRWNHIYDGNKMFSNVTAHQTGFRYNINGDLGDNSILISSKIQDYGIKADWDYSAGLGHKIKFGFGTVYHSFRPNVFNTTGEIFELINQNDELVLNNAEFHAYVSDDWEINNKIRVSYGLRYTGSIGDVFYNGLEPRIATRYKLNQEHSLKLSFSTMRQYMHRVSSSSIALPTDLWYPVTRNVKPQTSHQIAFGYFGGALDNGLTWSAEVYAKSMDRLISYREGASVLFNNNFERELITGYGQSYGLELFLKKHTGRLSGWLSYTLARTDRTFEELNFGKTFPDRYDRRHNVSLVLLYKIAKNITWSANWVFLSGARITAQTGQYLMPNPSLTGIDLIPIYSSRNAVELSPAHRFDVNIVIKGVQRSFGRGEWHLSVYNFYNQPTPNNVTIRTVNRALGYQQTGIFGFVPSVAYNFSFYKK